MPSPDPQPEPEPEPQPPVQHVSNSFRNLPHSRSRRPRLPAPSALPPPTNDQFIRHLTQLGYTNSATLFSHTNLTTDQLRSLHTSDLNELLGITNLRHRRDITQFIAPSSALAQPIVPEFGKILVHLSNDRTFHSWIVSGTQMIVFALGITRISPLLRKGALISAVGVAIVAVGIFIHIYAVISFWSVMRRLEAGEQYTPDYVGSTVLLFLALGVAAAVIYVLLVDGIV